MIKLQVTKCLLLEQQLKSLIPISVCFKHFTVDGCLNNLESHLVSEVGIQCGVKLLIVSRKPHSFQSQKNVLLSDFVERERGTG